MDLGNSLWIILPGLVLVATAIVVFAVDLFVVRKGVLGWLAAAGLVAAAATALTQWFSQDGLAATDGRSGFAGMIGWDAYTVFCIVLFCVVGVLTIMLSDAYLARRQAARGEFYGLMLLVVTGMFGLVASTDIISFFVSFELMSLPTYILAGYLWRNAQSGEASLKYFVTGAFSSAILAFGLALVYGASGQTNYGAIAEGLSGFVGDDARSLLVVALILVVTGFGFKVSAVPFHGWAPDVYEGAPTPVTAFMSVAVKAAAFAGFARFFVVAVDLQWGMWANAMIILAVLTMVIGNVLALPQRNLKRMLAYSSIAHAGYLMLGLVAAGAADDTLGLAAILFYLAAYACMNLGAFGVLIWIRNRRTFEYTLDEIAGLSQAMPWASIFMAFFMVSLIGIPPTIGFWGKFYLFTAVVQADYTWLAIVAVIMSSVSAYYYLRVIWYMYFREVTHVVPAVAVEPAVVAPAGGEASTLISSTAEMKLHLVKSVADEPADTSGVDAAIAPSAIEPSSQKDLPAKEQLGTVVAVSLTAVGVLALGLFPGPLLSAAEGAVRVILGG